MVCSLVRLSTRGKQEFSREFAVLVVSRLNFDDLSRLSLTNGTSLLY